MDPWADQLAIATHGDPATGFGAAAVVYWLFTPEYEAAVAEKVATDIAEARGNTKTHRQQNPPDLLQAAAEVASGQDPQRAFTAALARLNMGAKGAYFNGNLIDEAEFTSLSFTDLALTDLAFAERVIESDELTYGVVVTHHKRPDERWARLFVFIWFISDQHPDRQAARTPTRGALAASPRGTQL